jgi:hypothetical protein
VSTFTHSDPKLEDYWRSIILFGSNVASYKFALARSLLTIGRRSGDLIRLDELAVPFAGEICRHLALADRQSTSRSSRFLDACRAANRGEISQGQLVEQTVRLGFNNVIDAFHVVNREQVPKPFFTDERTSNNGIRLTENFFKLNEGEHYSALPHEVEARWRLVETAWELDVSRTLVAVEVDATVEQLVVSDRNRRKTVTSCRAALNGYQKGRCFYCFRVIAIEPGAREMADVDHFIPHALKRERTGLVLDGVWNLVLACVMCNRGENGKSAQVPSLRLLERLHRRNEYLIESHHPLRETLVQQTGTSTPDRIRFLQAAWNEAKRSLVHEWEPVACASGAF